LTYLSDRRKKHCGLSGICAKNADMTLLTRALSAASTSFSFLPAWSSYECEAPPVLSLMAEGKFYWLVDLNRLDCQWQ
jgi:hypothetical protein